MSLREARDGIREFTRRKGMVDPRVGGAGYRFGAKLRQTNYLAG